MTTQMTMEDVELLRTSAREWVSAEYPAKPDHHGLEGETSSRWAEMSALGWCGTAISENAGGLGLGMTAIGVLAEELGRELVTSPLISSGLVAGEALRAQPAGATAALLGAIASGGTLVALAFDEGAHHDGRASTATAQRHGDGWHLTARKRFVVDGTAADWFVCTAQTDELALFLVPRDASQVTPLDTIDGRDVAHVSIDADLGDGALLAGGAPLVSRLSDLARLGVAAEMIGAAERALEITLSYLRTREQFGRPIGSFQGLQHRAALMHIDLQLARACVANGWRVAEDEAGNLAAAASLAKFMAGEAIHRISSEIVQMHGGIGMTAEHVAGRYLKWARVSEKLYGDSRFLADRYATATGF